MARFSTLAEVQVPIFSKAGRLPSQAREAAVTFTFLSQFSAPRELLNDGHSRRPPGAAFGSPAVLRACFLGV